MKHYDIVIVGGGMIGLTTALACAQGRSLRIAVVEAREISSMQEHSFDGRVSAIAYGARQFLSSLGAWGYIEDATREGGCGIGQIRHIIIADGQAGKPPSTPMLHYDISELEGQVPGDASLGYMVENRFTRAGLLRAIEAAGDIDIISPTTVGAVQQKGAQLRISLGDGEQLSTQLLIAADGRMSLMRDMAGIDSTEHDYGQTAIVCTVEHERPHGGAAVEYFLPNGPFAILPLGGYENRRSAIVWSESHTRARIYMSMARDAFMEELGRRFSHFFGKARLVEDGGGRWSYPLNLRFAHRYRSGRICLIGDAAHGIHPIAGQGLNLSLRDVEYIGRKVSDASSLGLDIGSDAVLGEYEHMRHKDNLQMITVTDALTHLFSNALAPVSCARRAGLGAVGLLPPLKKHLMKEAMGL